MGNHLQIADVKVDVHHSAWIPNFHCHCYLKVWNDQGLPKHDPAEIYQHHWDHPSLKLSHLPHIYIGSLLISISYETKYFSLSDPHHDKLFCPSFWHLIWKYTWYILFWHSTLAFYLTFFSGILSGILPEFYLASILTFFLASILGFYLAFYLASILAFSLPMVAPTEIWCSRWRSGSTNLELEGRGGWHSYGGVHKWGYAKTPKWMIYKEK